MNKSYKKRFQKFSKSLSDPALINYARQNGKNTFSRKRKLPLKDMLLCCLSKKVLTTTFELRNYFREKEDLSMQLSIQGYLLAGQMVLLQYLLLVKLEVLQQLQE